jgi:hypothetical protein
MLLTTALHICRRFFLGIILGGSLVEQQADFTERRLLDGPFLNWRGSRENKTEECAPESSRKHNRVQNRIQRCSGTTRSNVQTLETIGRGERI